MVFVFRTDLYKSWLQKLEAEIEDRRKDLENDRREAIEALNEAWLKMGGSEQDLVSIAADDEVEDVASSSVKAPPAQKGAHNQLRETGENVPARNGTSEGSTIHMKTIRREVLAALSDMESDIITQTEIKARLLDKYPDANVARAAAAISRALTQLTERGELELVERGIAREPHKYRKTDRETEVDLLGP